MNSRIIMILFFCVTLHPALSQGSIEDILSQIEANNTTLKALRVATDASKIGNTTGINPHNPEIEFANLWGTPSIIGLRRNFLVSQSVEFPTVYSYRKQISNARNNQADLSYNSSKSEILTEAKQICMELIYQNAMERELTIRLDHANVIAEAYQTRIEKGETNLMEWNKARLNLLNASNDLQNLQIERDFGMNELARLNGGIPLTFQQSYFEHIVIPPDFDAWFRESESRIPDLTWIQQEVGISDWNEKLTRASNLPVFSGGYLIEALEHERFQGFHIGMSIPLWENKNTRRFAKAKSMATKSLATDVRLQLYNELKSHHEKALQLQNTLNEYKSVLYGIQNAELLKMALEKGLIGLSEYLLELSVYYDAVDRTLSLERDLNIAYLQLIKYLL
jgi:outer membrane protein, heavy metal efflux system